MEQMKQIECNKCKHIESINEQFFKLVKSSPVKCTKKGTYEILNCQGIMEPR